MYLQQQRYRTCERGHHYRAGLFYSMDKDVARAIEQDDYEYRSDEKLGHTLTGLDARSRHILQRRRLDEDKATLQELARHYKVSAERIRQLENNAIKKLRVAMA